MSQNKLFLQSPLKVHGVMWNMVCFPRRAIGVPFLWQYKVHTWALKGQVLLFKCFPVEKEALKEKLLSVSFDMLFKAKNDPAETYWTQGISVLPSEQLTRWYPGSFQLSLLGATSSLTPTEETSVPSASYKSLSGWFKVSFFTYILYIHLPFAHGMQVQPPYSIKAEFVTLQLSWWEEDLSLDSPWWKVRHLNQPHGIYVVLRDRCCSQPTHLSI